MLYMLVLNTSPWKLGVKSILHRITLAEATTSFRYSVDSNEISKLVIAVIEMMDKKFWLNESVTWAKINCIKSFGLHLNS